MVEEKMHTLNTSAKNMEKIYLDVEALESKALPPKDDFSETIKYIQISMNESRERIARMEAKEEFLEKALPLGFYQNHDEYHKIIGTSPIEYFFTPLNVNDKGTRNESNLIK